MPLVCVPCTIMHVTDFEVSEQVKIWCSCSHHVRPRVFFIKPRNTLVHAYFVARFRGPPTYKYLNFKVALVFDVDSSNTQRAERNAQQNMAVRRRTTRAMNFMCTGQLRANEQPRKVLTEQKWPPRHPRHQHAGGCRRQDHDCCVLRRGITYFRTARSATVLVPHRVVGTRICLGRHRQQGTNLRTT